MPIYQWYFTFGSGQEHANCFIIIRSASRNGARDIMYDTFGNVWSMQYDSAEEAGVEEYHLKEIDLDGNFIGV